MRRWIIGTGVVVLAGLLLAGAAWANRSDAKGQEAPQGHAFEPAEAVVVAGAEQVSWQPTADLVGTVVAVRSVALSNEVAGVVTSVGFESGSVVEPGQVLVTLDDSKDRADLAVAQANVRVMQASVPQAETRIRLAEIMVQRLEKVEGRGVAEAELDRARAELETARADKARWEAEVERARAGVAQVEARLAKFAIRAPFRARTGMRTVHPGQYLGEGASIVGLQELTDRIYLDFAIPQEYAPKVVPGTTVAATAPVLGPGTIAVEVIAMDATVNPDTRNIRVRASVANPRGLLIPGMSVPVRVPLDEPRMLVAIPSTAVRRAAYGNSVFLVAPDDTGKLRARQKFVTLGQSLGERVIVLDGISPGDRVAAAGSFKLRDGALIMPPAPAGTPAPHP